MHGQMPQPGSYTITAVATDDKGNTTTSDPVSIKVNVAQARTRHGTAIPGKIEFENYDLGVNGFAYKDDAEKEYR